MPRKVQIDGREVTAVDVGFELIQDGSVRVRTEDGAILRVRPVIVSVLRTEERTPEGDPQYVVQSFVHVFAEPAKEEGKP